MSNTIMAAGLLKRYGDVRAVDGVSFEVEEGAQLSGTIKITKTTDRDDALKEVEKGDKDAAVEQQGDQLIVHYSAADPVKAGTVQGILNSIVQSANQAAGAQPPKYTVKATQVEDESLKPIQFYTPGLLGWAPASAGMFGAAATLVTWRTPCRTPSRCATSTRACST